MRKLVGCFNCGELFTKEIRDIKRSKKDFCNRSCAAKYNNRKYPKRKPKNKCKLCKKSILTSIKYCKECREKKRKKRAARIKIRKICKGFPKRKRRTSEKKRCHRCNIVITNGNKYCRKCFEDKFLLKNKTIGEVFDRDVKSNSSQYGTLRNNARLVAKNNNFKKECAICEENNHVVVCHIKPITHFPKSTKVFVVNDPNNLIILCENCHWEFDHGEIDKKLIEAKIALRDKQLLLF